MLDTLDSVKTLAMLKMEKNFRALISQGYPRQPYRKQNTQFLLKRLREEVEELDQAIRSKRIFEAKRECADASNVIDYIFERISEGMLE